MNELTVLRRLGAFFGELIDKPIATHKTNFIESTANTIHYIYYHSFTA